MGYRSKQFEVIEEELKTLGMDINNLKNCRPIPYIYNMDEMYALSDLIVARSGAMTITELAITCKPAVFIPLPSVGANRQEDNARVVESLGGAEVILNSELDSVILSEKLDRLTSNLDNLKQMGMKVNLLEIKNVEDKIYKEIKKVIQK